MDPITGLFLFSMAMSMASGASQYSAMRAAGKAQQRAAEYGATLAERRADAMEMRAGEERATAQRSAMEQRRQGRLLESRARALAAASGGGATDPTVTNILGDIEYEADYRALTASYEGETMAHGLEYAAVLERAGADGQRYAGTVERRLANAQANRALLTGAIDAAGTGIDYLTRKPKATDAPTSYPTLADSSVNRLYAKYAQGGYG
jgi:hypothetical protein